MNTILDTARSIAHTFLNFDISENGLTEVTDEILKETIGRISAINLKGELNEAGLFNILRADFSRGKGKLTEISDNIQPWLNDARSSIDFRLWNRYKLYLTQEDHAFPINDLDDFTDAILNKCVNPKQPGSWDRRGMVVGHVQSGKTANYVGLINKAADAGYKLIIVLAGTMNSLRRQTQQRIDQGFIGINTATGDPVGVGKMKDETQIYALTSSMIFPDGDFDRSIAAKKAFPIGKNPVVLVIKKNVTILENLIDWLSSNTRTQIVNGQYKLTDVPALIIDDEADSASVNTVSRKKITREQALEEAKTINRLIRTLLNLFEKNTFVGYTATPYANLFIPQAWSEKVESDVKGRIYQAGSDLFPKDFILNIRAARNYLGAAAVFGYENHITGEGKEPLNVIRTVDLAATPFLINTVDANGRPVTKTPKKGDPLPDELPESMKEAIMAFFIVCAVRRLRGQETKHNSMLVHVMLYVNWIDRIARLVHEQLQVYKNYISGKDPVFMQQLKRLFEKDFAATTPDVLANLNYTDLGIKEHQWESVAAELHKAVSKIEVRAVHGSRAADLEHRNIEEIDYDKYKAVGLSVIAVGGSRLARGLTLEGLSVSYYLRASKMYDTLMQMGRWFGYRPGYADLIRIYTTNTLASWFNHIAMATEGMRNDFDELSALPDVRPKDFQLKVQNHPGLLTVTAATKLFWAETLQVSFSGQNPQTYQLLKEPTLIQQNYDAFRRLLQTAGKPKPDNIRKLKNGDISHYIFRDFDANAICTFLDAYYINQPSIKNATLSGYIRRQKQIATIRSWNVVFRSNTDDRVFISDTEDKITDRSANAYVKRYPFNDGSIEIGAVIRNQRTQRSSPYYYISKNQIDDLGDRRIDLPDGDLGDNDKIRAARAAAGTGLLLIYLLDPRCTPHGGEMPYVGFSIHFPAIKGEQPVSYTATAAPDMDNTQEDDDPREGDQ